MTAGSIEIEKVEAWMRRHDDVFEFSPTQHDGVAGYRVKLGRTAVFVPMEAMMRGVEDMRAHLKVLVEQAMMDKAETMESAAFALRMAVMNGVEIPPAD